MMRLIQEGKYEFSHSQWESITEDAKELVRATILAKNAVTRVFQIRRLLTVDVTLRIKSSDCLKLVPIRYILCKPQQYESMIVGQAGCELGKGG